MDRQEAAKNSKLKELGHVCVSLEFKCTVCKKDYYTVTLAPSLISLPVLHTHIHTEAHMHTHTLTDSVSRSHILLDSRLSCLWFKGVCWGGAPCERHTEVSIPHRTFHQDPSISLCNTSLWCIQAEHECCSYLHSAHSPFPLQCHQHLPGCVIAHHQCQDLEAIKFHSSLDKQLPKKRKK